MSRAPAESPTGAGAGSAPRRPCHGIAAMTGATPPGLAPEAIAALLEARHGDPFAILGRHPIAGGISVRALRPGAAVMRIEDGPTLDRVGDTALFEWHGSSDALAPHYRLQWLDEHGQWHSACDPYTFAPQLADFDLHLFGEGRHRHAQRLLGARCHRVEGIDGVLFSVWAPNAERVSLVGDWNGWDGRVHPMRVRGGSGVFELFIPGIESGVFYKFELRTRLGVVLKSDPYARAAELRPGTASRVVAESTYRWRDDDGMSARPGNDWLHRPLSAYEVHAGSWHRDGERFLDYRELGRRLADYATRLGFTHVELLPITEHPLDASWGYQTTGYFAPTSRFGGPDDLRALIDTLHAAGIGVLLDWVPGHFPRDTHALACFDGTALYEHEDPRRGEHRDWGTLIYNFGRNEVRSFLISSALWWLQEFHIDGLRVDAVASMLYLDYSREPGEWLPNRYGGRENLEAVSFLRELNEVTHELAPGTVTIAEESTAWPQVTRPTWVGGLGFSMKWNMGWMHDTLDYLGHEPVHRKWHHERLTFGMLYAWSENYLLPLSHDEVVHGKHSLLGRMPGDRWQQFANLRLLYAYQWTYPGKKLLFMGGELGDPREWDHDRALDWGLESHPSHAGVQHLVGDLNRLYSSRAALHGSEFDAEGFAWIDCHDAEQSVVSYVRRHAGEVCLVVLNFTPVPRNDYYVGVPFAGDWHELLNSDSRHYGGSDLGNGGTLVAEPVAWMGQPARVRLTLPPLAALVLAPR